MSEGEVYLGGFSSGSLKKGRMAGYGIYATNWRIIGIKARKKLAGVLVGAALGGAAGALIGQSLSRDQGAKMIQDLEEKKDFEVKKENLSRVELKKPTWWHRGHVLVTPINAEPVKIMIGSKKEFENLKSLMVQFAPERVSVV